MANTVNTVTTTNITSTNINISSSTSSYYYYDNSEESAESQEIMFGDAYEFIGQLCDHAENNTSHKNNDQKLIYEDYSAHSTLSNNNGNISMERIDPYY